MQRRLITVILFAVVAAFASSTVLYRIISARSAQASDAPTKEIYVAARDLTAGTMVAESDLRLEKWPGAINPQWILKREELIGRALTAGVDTGEPIPASRVAAKGSGISLASGIPSGMRVVPVHVDQQGGLARIIAAGMHVDVLSTEAAAGQNGLSAVTHTILQNVKVFSTDEPADKSLKEKLLGAQSVNLLVTPEQAETLSQAIVQNRIQLALRNPADDSNITDTIAKALLPTKVRQLMPEYATEKAASMVKPEVKAEAPAAAPKPALPTIEIVQGTKRTVTVVAPSDTVNSTPGVTQ